MNNARKWLRLLPLVLLTALLMGPLPAGASREAPPQPVPAQDLEDAIERVIEQPEYAWRAPRQPDGAAVGEGEDLNFVQRWIKAFDEKLRDFARWLRTVLKRLSEWLGRDRYPAGGPSFVELSPQLLWLVGIAAVITAAVMIGVRLWREKGRRASVTAQAVAATPDITREDLTADELPPDEWLNMADDFIQREEWRLAIRALFLSCLAFLARQNAVTIARFKSNREYKGELQRRHHDRPALQTAFGANVRALEDVWYGNHVADPDLISRFRDRQQSIISAFDAQQATHTHGGAA